MKTKYIKIDCCMQCQWCECENHKLYCRAKRLNPNYKGNTQRISLSKKCREIDVKPDKNIPEWCPLEDWEEEA